MRLRSQVWRCGRPRAAQDGMDDMQPEELRVEKLVEKLETAIDGMVKKVRPSEEHDPEPGGCFA